MVIEQSIWNFEVNLSFESRDYLDSFSFIYCSREHYITACILGVVVYIMYIVMVRDLPNYHICSNYIVATKFLFHVNRYSIDIFWTFNCQADIQPKRECSLVQYGSWMKYKNKFYQKLGFRWQLLSIGIDWKIEFICRLSPWPIVMKLFDFLLRNKKSFIDTNIGKTLLLTLSACSSNWFFFCRA